jgi:CubicO group peptidase (beta-lactamase class C family)
MRQTVICLLLFLLPARAGGQELTHEVTLFQKYLEALRHQLKIPGLSAAVLKDERIIWEGGFGFQDVEQRIPATADTPYPIASITKTFTSDLLLRCVERGALDLDTPIARYTTAIPESGATVRHVLTHTSEGTPGGMFRYNGDRYATLTAVVEACSGSSIRELFRDMLDRATMQDSVPGHDLEANVDAASLFDDVTLRRYRQTLARIAKPYKVDSRGRVVRSPYPPKGINASAGLVSTAHDLALYDLSLSSHLFISSATQEAAWTVGTTTAGELIPYGLGWFVEDIERERVVWHYGLWGDSFSSLILKVPARGLTVVLLANSDGLSAKFPLAAGDAMVSPFAATFLRIFSPLWDTANAQGWFVSPSIGMTFKTKTGFIDLDDAASTSKPVIAVSGGRISRHVGFEAEAAWLPSFFSGRTGLVTDSRVVTTTAHAMFPLPRGRLPVNPYATIGGGAMFVHMEDVADVFTSTSVLKTAVVGGGALIPIKKKKWTWRADLRHVRSEHAKPQRSIPVIDARSLSFWRASVGMVFLF